jgi:predicted HTH domain antitoxin
MKSDTERTFSSSEKIVSDVEEIVSDRNRVVSEPETVVSGVARILPKPLSRLSAPEKEISMSQITLDIPDETLLALKVSGQEVGGALRMAAAMKLFELGRLSSGAAARLAGVPRAVFLSHLADYGVDTFTLTEEDFGKETHLA